ncbi:putative defense protein 3 [Phymastichus coffea]|uniref:putative defense protein 3 n=1 Tax=Phymastichus coffea TaxID=108790 RepID=UPI00273BFA15|nr:putative defense protein 3 [Phymastichus coffea]XP_058792254.1 putative defense protein 3 [Phymastichus coffea]
MTSPTILTLTCLAALASGFPDGAPVDTCVKPRVNQPYHGQARSQPLASNPYQVIASSDNYRPGSQITVKIQGANFKGFFLQARDAQTNEWIGSWAKTANTNAHHECSAVTHNDPRDKQLATLLWNAPQNGRVGTVYFTGTILKNYSTFWSDIVSQVGR